MSLDIHRSCQTRLIERLAAVLPTIRCHNGKFLDYESAVPLSEIDSTLPEAGKIRDTLSRLIGEMPFSDFVRGALQIEIYRDQPYSEDKNPIPLTQLAAYRDVAAVAGRLVAEFVSLPWKYTLTIAVPHDIGTFFRTTEPTFALSTAVRIVTPDDQFTTDYPPPPVPMNFLNALSLMDIMRGHRNEWDRDKGYLQVQVEGFIPMFGLSTPLEDGIGQIKSFFGLGIAHRLFEVKRRFGEPPGKAQLWIHRRAGERWEFGNSVDLDSSVSSLLYNVTASEFFAGIPSEEQRRAVARRALDGMVPPFSAGPLSDRLLLASQWHFESYGGSDEMLSFVQAAVVLEILLGDKAASDVAGLGELLRNRCAYLISRNHAEREEILRDFRAIYDVRSKIVHAGKKHLNVPEWRLFSRLRWICQRVIQEETRLLSGKRR